MRDTTPSKLWPFPFALLIAATACTTEVVDPAADDPSTGGSGGGGATTTTSSEGGSGGSSSQPLDLTKSIELSECGGFEIYSGSGDSGGSGELPPAYCDAEVLYWTYDAALQQIYFFDSRIELNCCGDHGIAVQQQADTLAIIETDEPEGGTGRCNCMCVFDYAVTAGPVAEGTVSVELLRHVTDEGDAGLVWQGTIDLTAGSGFEIVDTTPATFCEPYDSAPSAS